MKRKGKDGFLVEEVFQGRKVYWWGWWLDNIKPHKGMTKYETLQALEAQAEIDIVRLKKEEEAKSDEDRSSLHTRLDG